MKTLTNHTLIYDADCPLCVAYTSTFIKTKMLDANGRKSFVTLTAEDKKYVDLERATNEIALLDTENNKVIYGVDSLLKVIGSAYPLLEKLGKNKMVYTLARYLYFFVSYNRKVIVPSKEAKKETSCTPSFNYTYRFLYILLMALGTSYIWFSFFTTFTSFRNMSFYGTFFLFVGQLLVPILILAQEGSKQVVHYIGNLVTVSFLGGFGLLQIIGLQHIVQLPTGLVMVAVLGVLSLMFLEHKRRLVLLQLPSVLSYAWVLYGIVIGFILKFI